MLARTVLASVAVCLAIPSLPIAATAQTCTEADRPAHAITMAKPIPPPEAAKQHITGVVEVVVRLADDGTVRVATAVSGDAILRPSAVEAVKHATFEADYHACEHHGGLYKFIVEYADKTPNPSPTPSPSAR